MLVPLALRSPRSVRKQGGCAGARSVLRVIAALLRCRQRFPREGVAAKTPDLGRERNQGQDRNRGSSTGPSAATALNSLTRPLSPFTG